MFANLQKESKFRKIAFYVLAFLFAFFSQTEVDSKPDFTDAPKQTVFHKHLDMNTE